MIISKNNAIFSYSDGSGIDMVKCALCGELDYCGVTIQAYVNGSSEIITPSDFICESCCARIAQYGMKHFTQ